MTPAAGSDPRVRGMNKDGLIQEGLSKENVEANQAVIELIKKIAARAVALEDGVELA